MAVNVVDAINFREICSSVSKKIEELKLPFVCREFYNHFMWVCDRDYYIGHTVCHYEIRLDYVDERKIFVEIHLEGGSKNELEKILDAHSVELDKIKGVDAPGNRWYRRKEAKSFPVNNDDDNINAIIAELYTLHSKFSKELIEKIKPTMINDDITF